MKTVIAHFENIDPIIAKVVAAAFAGERPIALGQPIAPEMYFRKLASSVVSQQLSVKAAATIWQRFEALLGEITPERVLEFDIEAMRSTGVSRQKAGYVTAMAASVLNEEVNLMGLATMNNDDVIAELTKLTGIGPWTAEMFLMFALARPDVFSYLDLGLVRAFELVYDKSGVTRVDMEPVVEQWAPYRTYAALALWRHRDNE